MPKKFLSTIKLYSASSNPGSGSAGEIFYDSTNNIVKYHNGTTWTSISGGSGGVTYTKNTTAPSSPNEGDKWLDTDTGIEYTYVYDGTSGHWWVELGTGGQGPAGTVSVGTVTTGAAGSSATITNSGTQYAAVLNFTIPRGDTGATGSTGPAANQTIVWNRAGTVSTTTGAQRFRFPANATIIGASLALNTSGSTSTTVSIKKNGTALTFASALTLGSGATALAEQAISGSASVVAGDYLTVDITAAGTSASDLSVFLRYY